MNRRTIVCAIAVLVAAGAMAHSAHAAVRGKNFVITNNSGAARSDLHLEVTWTGGTATLRVIRNAPGCPDPVVSNPGTPFDINWGSACVGAGESITVQVIGDFVQASEIASGYWTPGTPGQFPLSTGDVTAVPVPGLPTWGIGALTLLLLAAGAAFLRRREPATA
ncbi:MAG: hypothetical protein A2V63_00085 [Candidatus Eisenbacteria bacterium RBG_19FT_COMBO_70_11]|nr:MAG: hypothetical protein A2V63_00085 [Candidatus Eisenbacteria bacterium RBG_19FT_COMBO_70_11]